MFLDGDRVICSALASVVLGDMVRVNWVFDDAKWGDPRAVVGNDHAFHPGNPTNSCNDPTCRYLFSRIKLVTRQRR